MACALTSEQCARPSVIPCVRASRGRSEEHTSELQSQSNLVCRLLLEKKKKMHQSLFKLRRILPPKSKLVSFSYAIDHCVSDCIDLSMCTFFVVRNTYLYVVGAQLLH